MDLGAENIKFIKKKGVNILVSGGEREEADDRSKALISVSQRKEKPLSVFKNPIMLAALGAVGISGVMYVMNDEKIPFANVNAEGPQNVLSMGEPAPASSGGEVLTTYFPRAFEAAYGQEASGSRVGLDIPGEKEVAFGEVMSEIEKLELSNEQIINIRDYEQKIREYARSAEIPEELFLGLIITESKGNRFAVSAADCRGLTQMSTLIAEKYGLYVTEEVEDVSDERYIPEKILPASAAEIREYYEKYGDWTLALWAWHAGEPQVNEAITSFLEFEYYLPVADFGSLQNEIKKHGINFYRIFQSEEIKKKYVPGYDKSLPPDSLLNLDRTDIYVTRIIAWEVAWENLKASGLAGGAEE